MNETIAECQRPATCTTKMIDDVGWYISMRYQQQQHDTHNKNGMK